MAGKLLKAKHATITAATASGYITLASVEGFYETALVFLTPLAASEGVAGTVTEVNHTTNQLGIRLDSPASGGVSYGRSNMAAFNGGIVDLTPQLIYVTDPSGTPP
jgi:hypothetical protein